MSYKGILVSIGLVMILLATAGTADAKSGFTGVNCSYCHGQPANDVFKAVHKFDGISFPTTTISCGHCHTNLTTVFFPLTTQGAFYNSTHRYNETTLASRLLVPPACADCHVNVRGNDFSISSGPEKYLTSSMCNNCHKKKYDDWYGTLHRVMLTNATKAQEMDIPLPPGISWENVSFMIIGKNSFRYLNESGYFSYTYDVVNETFSSLNGTQYTCGSCHTTGYSPDGSQNGLSGIVGTWNETGIACERCHGPAGNGHHVEVNASGYLCIECHSGPPNRFNTGAWTMSAHAPPMEVPARCTMCHSPFDYYKNNSVTSEDAINVPCATCHNPHNTTEGQYRELLSSGGFNATKMTDVKDPVLSFFNATASKASLTGGTTSTLTGGVTSTLTAGNDLYDVLTTPALISAGIDASYNGQINVTGPVSEVLCSKCHYNHGLGAVGEVNLTHARMNYPGLGLEPATCTDCHMSGSQGNHSFNVKDELNFPSKTCSRGTECHVTSEQNLNHSTFSIVPIVNEWKSSGHNNTAFAQEGEPENTSRCARCHSPVNWDPLNASASIAPEDYDGVTCAICHNIHDMGDWLKKTGMPYAWYKRDAINRTSYYRANYTAETSTTGLCTNCHQNRPEYSMPGWTGRGPHGAIVPHISAQKDMFNGSVKQSDQNFECADCHMFIRKTDPGNMTEQVLPDEQKITGHTFRMNAAGLQEYGQKNNINCSGCHADGSSLGNLSARIDAVQSDIKDKWNSTNETVENIWTIYDAFNGEKTISGDKLAEAFFDLYQVSNDRSWGVHNPMKANDLLNQSLRLANEANASLVPSNVTINIISILPAARNVKNDAGEKRTFMATVDHAANVTWLINGTEVQSNSSVSTATYINESAQQGIWNVTAVASTDTGIDTYEWDWTVRSLPPVRVEIMNFAFNPANITIQKGMTVIWTNNDSTQHTITSDTGLFDSESLNPGESFEWTFNETGTFDYHCSIHPSMQGKVIAVSAPSLVPPPKDEVSVELQLVAKNLTAPVALVSPDDGTGRRFIVDQIGVVKILMPDGHVLEEPFMDIRSKIVTLRPQYDERGLLGLAFHPNFSQNGRFFVYYSAPLRPGVPAGYDHTSNISEFSVSHDDLNKSDPDSEKVILQVDKPQSNHNAGQIAFGPDGYLYIPLGDGGGANDEGLSHPQPGNGQNISSILGKILRIDVDNGIPYGIPQDNPFVGKDGLDEIFAYGFRNPFHISFDAGGDNSLFVSDAGQNAWEEVDMVTKGNNYGWNIKEGTHCFDPNNPSLSPESCSNAGENGENLTDPIIEYANSRQTGGIGVVVTGGYVYRGSAIPQLNGAYIFGDLSKGFASGDGTLLVARPDGQMWSIKELSVASNPGGRVEAFVRSFGQDADNEIYVLTSEKLGPTNNTGKVFKIKPVSISHNFIANLSGDEVVPPVDTQANGSAEFELNDNGTRLYYKVMVENISNVTMAHIHMAPPGENGPVVAWLYPNMPPSALIPGRFDGLLAEGNITDANLTGPLANKSLGMLMESVMNGNTYVNVHTEQYPAGEVRGQIKPFEPVPIKAPKITESYPKSSDITDIIGGPTRTFTIEVNQIVNVSWQINGAEVYNQTDVDNSSYSNDSAVIGVWDVSAVVQNANGSDRRKWVWKVREPMAGNGSISGMKFNDSNGDGRKNKGESGLSNWTILLKNSSGSLVGTVVTDQDGKYKFGNLEAGNYTVEEAIQEGWQQTFPDAPGIYNITLASNDKVKGIDFGNNLKPPAPPGINGTRKIQIESLRLGQSTNVTVSITSDTDESLVLKEVIPKGWNFTRISDDADGFKNKSREWAWSNVTPGVAKNVKYSITAPDNADIGTYYINGTITNPAGEISIVGGDTMITLDILAYYRRLGQDPDSVETRDMLRAMDDWRKGKKPPGFARSLNMQELAELIDEWINS